MATRTIGAALVDRGVDVSVVLPQGVEQAPVEELYGMTVHGFPLWRYPLTGSLYRHIDADIYHSEGLSWGSQVSLMACRGKGHMLTFQNPRTDEEWSALYGFYPWRRRAFNALYGGRLVKAVRGVDAVYCQARYQIPKVRVLYGLSRDPGFLPNPVDVPSRIPLKGSEPTVCFLGRFDGEKRPELFFELAMRFPDVRFVAAGQAHSPSRDRELRAKYGGISNLELPGMVTGVEKGRLLDEAWVLVNTSLSEGLPVSFLEASVHGCAILSLHDPDGFASRFGLHVEERGLKSGLGLLLESSLWRTRGEGGYAYVSEFHEKERVVDMHLDAYEALMGSR